MDDRRGMDGSAKSLMRLPTLPNAAGLLFMVDTICATS
jgi:hypothetical protein